MKPVKQLICHGEDNGDCLRACVASILELPIEDVPNFADTTGDHIEFWRLNNSWAMKKGFKYVTISISEDSIWDIIGDIFCIASAKSPRRKDQWHSVVWRNGIVHDPHPSNDFLAETPKQFTLLVPFNMKGYLE